MVLSTGEDRPEEERQVTKEQVANIQTTYRCSVVEVSCVTGSGVNEAVDLLIESARRVKMLNGATSQRRGWIRIKSKKGTKKRYAVLTHSGLRYYAAEPVCISSHYLCICVYICIFERMNNEVIYRHHIRIRVI